MTSEFPAWRRHLSLALLGLVAVVSYIDRQAIAVLQEDIKAEFALTDTMVGLISGLYFALIYGLAALPIARIADRGDRATLIGGCLAFWSVATAACGLVTSAWQLAAARMTMAVGEAGSGPASLALLTNIYSERRRGLVIGYYQAANSVGLSLGVILSAWLASFLEWRSVFLVLGLPGILLGVVVALAVTEPRRRGGAGAVQQPMPLKDVVNAVAGAPALRWVALLIVIVPMAGFGFLMWGSSFLARVHDFEKAQLAGLGFAILAGLVTGNLAAGWVSDRYGHSSPSFKGAFAAAGLLAGIPFALAFVLSPDPRLALYCFAGLTFFITLYMPPIISLCCDIVPAGMRATIIALIGLITIVAGQGFGTLLIGMLNDAYTPAFGDEAVRYSLVTISGNLLIGAIAAYMAGHTAARSAREAHASA